VKELANLRLRGVRILAGVACAISLIAMAWGLGEGAIVLAGSAALLCALPIWFALSGRSDGVARLVVGSCFPLLAGLVLSLASGTGWQIDMHMLFFAFLALTTLLADWRVIVVATILTALHHVALNLIAPQYLFQNGADILRVLFHAGIVLLEAGVLAFLCVQMEGLVVGVAAAREEQARIDAERAAERERVAREQQVVLDKLSERLDLLASGDLVTSLATPFPGGYDPVRTMLNSAIDAVRGALARVVEGMDTMTSGSNEIRSASDDLARRTESQAASLEETASAIAAINASVQDTALTSQRARGTLDGTVTRAEAGSQIVSQAMVAMQEIEGSSQKISNIISVIESISFQTNLLALNAGVEAARAGESGKGFAVVANEVRALAQRCAEAADEVKELVTISTHHVGNGVELVNRSGAAFTAILKDIESLSGAIQAIAASSSEQAGNLSQINVTVSDLDRSTQQNAAMAEQCTAAASSLTGEAAAVSRELAHFDLEKAAGIAQRVRPMRDAA